MGAGKWIGGIIGFMAGGPLGALAGYALGSLIELGGNTASYTTDYGNGQTEEDVFAGATEQFSFFRCWNGLVHHTGRRYASCTVKWSLCVSSCA